MNDKKTRGLRGVPKASKTASDRPVPAEGLPAAEAIGQQHARMGVQSVRDSESSPTFWDDRDGKIIRLEREIEAWQARFDALSKDWSRMRKVEREWDLFARRVFWSALIVGSALALCVFLGAI